MKTNHQRQFKASRHTDNAMWSDTRRDPLSGTAVFTLITNDFSKGRRGEAKAKRGAKKFLNSRIRFVQNAVVRQIIIDLP